MTSAPIRSRPGSRDDLRADAAAMGITDTYISTLVDSFYTRIRADAVLGPIFERRIGDDWDPHLARMKAFWGSVALYTGQYSGKPVPVHYAITEIEAGHFDHWLVLFEQTLEETAPTPGVVPYFMERARRIAESLKLAIFGVPELQRARNPTP
ncbi:group III truncated hemoglobin [Nisaea sp.]|uniref:group III truncated hemoglobin n=1 Tax=Nisaea sp. TaxID=2024842 RepID=UPI0032663F75